MNARFSHTISHHGDQEPTRKHRADDDDSDSSNNTNDNDCKDDDACSNGKYKGTDPS
jgi:hypothetical protein